MATTIKPKDTTSSLAKEKKVKAASNSQSTVHSNQPKRSLGSPSIKNQRPSSSPSEKKAIPNYLKPTISSRHESFKLGKKPGQDDGVSKPVLNRRRSFDKPVSISRTEKSFDSPGPRERTTHVRPSSSSLTKSTVAVSGRQSLLDSRESKSFKYGSKSPAVYVKSTLKKTGPASSCSGDDYSTESELESKVGRAENEFPISPQITASEVVVERDVVVPESEEADNGDSGKIEASEIVTVYEKVNEDENSLEGDEEKLVEDDGDKIEDKEDEPEEEEKEITKVDDTSSDCCNPDEISAKKAETEDKLREEVIHLDDKEDSTKQEKKRSEEAENKEDIGAVSKAGFVYAEEETVISKEGDDNEENKMIMLKEGEETENAEVELSNRHGQEQGRKEREETESATEETKPQTKTAAAAAESSSKRHGQGHGRKDTPAYNDVIEETASKLLEKRKNKVKALVGAFETVIDYESASK